MYFSPKTANDGLVFHYDTGNTVRSYKGEPTTNVLNNNIVGTGNGASLSSDSIGTYIQLANLTSSYSRFQLPNIPVSSNDTYTWSFELMSPETITTNYYFDTNEYSDQFPASNDLSRVSATARVPSTMPAGVWQEFSLTVTMKDGLTGAYTYDYFNMLYPTFQNKKIYYRNMQFEFKDHPTQYAGQGTTRSATQGLLDLTGNSTIDLTNVSFDSNAQLFFDGTDDYVNLGPGYSNFTNKSFAVEAVLYPNTSPPAQQVFFAAVGPVGGVQKNIHFRIYNSGAYRMGFLSNDLDTAGGVVTFGKYNHVVMQYNYNSDTSYIYVNGQLNVSGNQGPFTDSSAQIGVGYWPGSGQYFNGEIPVTKLYNRALTSDEIRRNYNSLKSRFNL